MNQPRQEVLSINKIAANIFEVEYYNGDKEKLPIIHIETRQEAIDIAVALTKKALLLPNSFDNLHGFKNDFSKMRNYEIEDYIDNLKNTIGHIIIQRCPFNGFSYND